MKFDHCYLVVSNLQKSVDLYSKLIGELPHNVENNWVDWQKGESPYFGLMSEHDWGYKGIKRGDTPVIVFTSINLEEEFKMVESIGLDIKESTTRLNSERYSYRYFIFSDFDGYTIEVAEY